MQMTNGSTKTTQGSATVKLEDGSEDEVEFEETDLLDDTSEDTEDVSVTMTRTRDNKVVTFSFDDETQRFTLKEGANTLIFAQDASGAFSIDGQAVTPETGSAVMQANPLLAGLPVSFLEVINRRLSEASFVDEKNAESNRNSKLISEGELCRFAFPLTGQRYFGSEYMCSCLWWQREVFAVTNDVVSIWHSAVNNASRDTRSPNTCTDHFGNGKRTLSSQEYP